MPDRPVVALDVGVLLRLAGLDVGQGDALLLGPVREPGPGFRETLSRRAYQEPRGKPESLMARITLIVLAYVFLSATALISLTEATAATIFTIPEVAPVTMAYFAASSWPALAGILLYIAVFRNADLLPRVRQAVILLMLCSLFFPAFTITKTHLSAIVPFYADPWLAELDAALHFGQDPWRLAHALQGEAVTAFGVWLYHDLWLIPAMFMPVILRLVDDDDARVMRFIYLYFLTWIVLGNLVALGLMSAGPVYYDRLFEAGRFAGLGQVLAEIDAPRLTGFQEFLWDNYANGRQSAGSGISAFPSVHIGMVTVWALYIAERFPRATPLSVALVVVYTFYSVYLGWHYAIDAYFSTLVLVLAWGALRSLKGQERTVAPLLQDQDIG